MLQIISGKYFTNDNKVNEDTCYDVLYSNFHTYSTIKTNIFTMEPLNSRPGAINKFLIIFNNRYQPSDEKDILVLPSSDPVIPHIKYILTFYFDCYFHTEKSHVQDLCSSSKNPNDVRNIASIHLPHLFNLEKKTTDSNAKKLCEFVDSVILLDRENYKLYIKLLSAYYNSIESFEMNYELSYMTLVYLLETLITETNEYTPQWDDFDQNRKGKLDKVFQSIETETVDNIKNILLKDSNLKLRHQFVNGLLELTPETFFCPPESENGKKVLPSELQHVLNNLYTTRSKYVHKLDSLEEVLKTYGYEKTNYTYDNEDPKFSIFGLINYVKEILNVFMKISPKVEQEECNWRNELPGIIQAKMAPEYWVWRDEGFTSKHSYVKFNGFIELLSQGKWLDIKKLVCKFEKILGQVKENEFTSIFAIYCIYNLNSPIENRSTNFDKMLSKYSSKLEECKIEYMVMNLYLQGMPQWKIEEQVKILEDYYKKKYRKSSIQLPKLIEISLISKIANIFLDEKDENKYLEYLDKAIGESLNNKMIYEYLNEVKLSREAIDLDRLKPKSN